MPGGPSIVILREQAAHFIGHKALRIGDTSRLDPFMKGRKPSC